MLRSIDKSSTLLSCNFLKSTVLRRKEKCCKRLRIYFARWSFRFLSFIDGGDTRNNFYIIGAKWLTSFVDGHSKIFLSKLNAQEITRTNGSKSNYSEF